MSILLYDNLLGPFRGTMEDCPGCLAGQATLPSNVILGEELPIEA
jgi:hypothetical protein